MNFRVANPLARWAIFALAAIVAACVTLAAVHNQQADHAAAAANLAGFTRAAQIEPGYAFYWYGLGANLRTDPDNPNPKAAISDFLRAIDDDPRDARTWMDLGDAYEETGDISSARHAYQQAEQVYPDSSDVAWRYGSFLLRQGETQDAYSHIRRALDITPTLTPLVSSRVWRATQDTKAVLTEVLPNPEYDFAALDWFCGDGDVDPALDAWKGIVATGKPLDIRDSFKLIDLLLEAQRGDDARLVWRQAVDLSGHSAELISGPSFLFNGGFEFDSANGGLDWLLTPRDGVGYDYDTSLFHEGKRSLRITFDGSENFDFNQVSQRVPVKPDTPYRFSAWLRTAGITTDSGPRFAIIFPGNLQQAIVLDGLTGDKDWTQQSADFVTGPNIRSLSILLLRTPSQKFDNKLGGSVWIDDVSLTPGTPRRQTP